MMTERPKCMNPKCNNLSICMVGSKMLCGECVMRLQEIKRKKEDEYFNILIRE